MHTKISQDESSVSGDLHFLSFFISNQSAFAISLVPFPLISVDYLCVTSLFATDLLGQSSNISWVHDAHSNCKTVCCKTD